MEPVEPVQINIYQSNTYRKDLKVVFATFLLVCFACLRESTCKTSKNVFYFTSKALFITEIIKS